MHQPSQPDYPIALFASYDKHSRLLRQAWVSEDLFYPGSSRVSSNLDAMTYMNQVSEPDCLIPLVAFYGKHGLLKTYSTLVLHGSYNY